MTTLHLTNHWHASSGGIRSWYRSLLDGANRERRYVRLVVPGRETAVERVGDFGRIYHLRTCVRAPFDRRYRLLLPHRYLLPAGLVRQVVEAEKPDLIEICDRFSLNWLAGLIRKRRVPGVGRPVLVGLACERFGDSVDAFLAPSAVARRLAAAYSRWCYVPLFDCHLAVSDYVRDELRGVMHPRHRRRVDVAPPGVEVSAFGAGVRDEAFRRQLIDGAGCPDSAVLMVYAGRLSPEKNVGLLLAVVDRLQAERAGRTWCLAVAGSGPMQGWLAEEARRRPAGQVKLLGQFHSSISLARLYASSDVFLHPNPREPFGIGPLEAMAAGCPVVLPRAGGVLSYAHAGNAWLVEPTAESFAEAVIAVTSDARARRERCRSARETAVRHGRAEAVGRVFRLYDEFRATVNLECAGFDVWEEPVARHQTGHASLGN